MEAQDLDVIWAGGLRKCSVISVSMFETPGAVPEGPLQSGRKWHAYNATPIYVKLQKGYHRRKLRRRIGRIVAPPVGAGGSACSSCSRVFTELELPLFFIAGAECDGLKVSTRARYHF